MWTPSVLWMPEQARQKKMPSLGEACCGIWSVCGLTLPLGRLEGVSLNEYYSPETYPLWTGSAAVDAAIVLVRLGDFTQF